MSKCDHKFVDSTSCLKCGWTPPNPSLMAQATHLWTQAWAAYMDGVDRYLRESKTTRGLDYQDYANEGAVNVIASALAAATEQGRREAFTEAAIMADREATESAEACRKHANDDDDFLLGEAEALNRFAAALRARGSTPATAQTGAQE